MQRPVVYIDVGNLLTMLKVCVNATSYYAGQIGLPQNPWKAHFASTFTEDGLVDINPISSPWLMVGFNPRRLRYEAAWETPHMA
jgi:hypothetical protein